ncbi:Pimeloyl-ACP methyl ester carboxylesterase [Rathayibacter oskolensis]|uniref:Pimeloyl-ACP methyl ester carboxylesterase n=1 Tax=Rathayibacter oskolensis TaxID=1891671 RepID=A0A1X7MUI8_9MICO|nr:alpha/beta hydrolase [Rathayibacter oskolensis]SMH28502.1 Pimeloyl-ACP methyl ester carboxylesterase [Rathayibacter oskolensis]
MTTTQDIDIDGVTLRLTAVGEGRTILLLHGGGGTATVLRWAGLLAEARGVRVLVPAHPGFDGTPRAASVASVRDLAALYLRLLERLDLEDVTVAGNSIGGWIAAEIAAARSPRVSGAVVIDAVGLVVDGHPYADFFSLTPAELAQRSYHDPERFGIDPQALPPEARAVMAANRPVIAYYGGDMTDPTLADRLPRIEVPTLVVWGDADRIGDPAVGEAYAAAIPAARLAVIPDSGHLPQIETPDALVELVGSLLDLTARDA